MAIYMPVCHYCGNSANFTFKNGKHCCAKSKNGCSAQKALNKKQNKKTWSDQSMRDTHSTLMEAVNGDQIKIDKAALTNQRKYGGLFMNSDEGKLQSRSTSLEKYGTEFASTSAIIRNKVISTVTDRYGVACVFKSTRIKDKIKDTLMTRYGVEHPLQYAEFAEKLSLVRTLKYKDYRFPSGKIIRVQGYEPKAIDALLKMGILESEIVTGKGQVPEIWYDLDGKRRRYYADIYIPKLNLIIEVKSLYTFMVEKDKNLAKRLACKVLGYKFNFVIR